MIKQPKIIFENLDDASREDFYQDLMKLLFDSAQ